MLARVGTLLASHLVGRTLLGTVDPAGQRLERSVDRLVAAAHAAFDAMGGAWSRTRCSSGGPARLAESFDAVETVRSVLAILEQQLVVVTLLRDVLDRGLSVAIGTEHGFEPLSSCAVVVAPGLGRRAGPRCGRASSARPGWTTRAPWPRPTWWASGSGERISGGHDGRH